MIGSVLVNWNNWTDTLECAESLICSSAKNIKIVVVDNASTNESWRKFGDWAEAASSIGVERQQDCTRVKAFSSFLIFDEVTNSFLPERNFGEFATDSFVASVYFINSSRNGGFGFGCNVGVRYAKSIGCSGVWLLNNDCIAQPAALSIVEQKISQDTKAVFGTMVYDYYKPQLLQCAGGGSLSKFTGRNRMLTKASGTDIDYAYGASMAFSINVFDTIGGFDEKIFMYFEEIDFCLRARQHEFRIGVIDAVVFHKGGASQDGGGAFNSWKHVFANKHYVLEKNLSHSVWKLFFYLFLLTYSVFPLGGPNKREAARHCLKKLWLLK